MEQESPPRDLSRQCHEWRIDDRIFFAASGERSERRQTRESDVLGFGPWFVDPDLMHGCGHVERDRAPCRITTVLGTKLSAPCAERSWPDPTSLHLSTSLVSQRDEPVPHGSIRRSPGRAARGRIVSPTRRTVKFDFSDGSSGSVASGRSNLGQCLRFNLTNPFARHREAPAHFRQR